MTFLNNLSIRMRMILSVLLFTATLMFAMYSAYTSVGASIEFAAQEKRGDLYQRPLSNLLHDAASLRVELAKAKAGMGDSSVETSLEKAIDTAMTGPLRKAQDEVGAALQFTDDGLKSRGREALKYETVLAKWKGIEKDLSATPSADHDAALVSFIADLRGMISHSGDISNLILDPDLDSYYLMDATLLALPQTMDRLATIGVEFLPALGSGDVSPALRTRAAVLSQMLSESDIDRLSGDMDTSLKEDANFYGVSASWQANGPKMFEAYKAPNKGLVKILDSIASGETPSAASFAAALGKAQATSHTFLMDGLDEMDKLLDFRRASYQQKQIQSLIASLIGILISFAFFFVVVRTITKPLAELTTSMRQLADNDFTASVGYTGAHSEIGEIAKSVEVFKENGLQMESLKAEKEKEDARRTEERKKLVADLATQFESSIGHIVEAVSAASTRLQNSAKNLSGSSARTTAETEAVSAAGDRTSASVQVVASAAEELSASIHEISHQVEGSTNMISGAVEQIENTNATVQSLADNSSKIGEIVSLINEIAGQTNLLALNATIEAARAGEAGKGFAVVASEVKNLANQTAHATEEITASISAMQQQTNVAVQAIQAIAKIIEQVSDGSQNIASAVSQQAAATQEISKNVQEVSSTSAEVSTSIGHVSVAAGEALSGSKDVLAASEELAEQSSSLKHEVGEFLSRVRAS